MYIIYHTEGQTCNHFFMLLYYLKKSIQEKQKLRVLFPDITIGDYPVLYSRNPYISYPLYKGWIKRIIGNRNQIRIIHRIYKKFCFPALRNAITKLSGGRMVFVDGMKHGGDNIDYSDLTHILQPLFVPNIKITQKVDKLFGNIEGKCVVGVHIRGGDYRLWRGGKYFYQPKEYYQYMKKMVSLLNMDTNEIVFFISTNDPIDLDSFKGLKCIMIENAKAVEDLYALSKCNYIIGTVSTFSGWASFLNRIPRYYITAEGQYKDLILDDFEIPNNSWVDLNRKISK